MVDAIASLSDQPYALRDSQDVGIRGNWVGKEIVRQARERGMDVKAVMEQLEKIFDEWKMDWEESGEEMLESEIKEERFWSIIVGTMQEALGL